MSEINGYQQAYFKFMTQSREHVFYISEHIAIADKWNTRINMFMAIASSSSIGAWVIWQKFSWIWAGVIAGSHVVGAIKDHLPFKSRRVCTAHRFHCFTGQMRWCAMHTLQLLNIVQLADQGRHRLDDHAAPGKGH